MSDIEAVTVPKWGLAMEEGKIVEWLVGEGEAVARAADLVDIETTKITNTLEAPAGGTLRRLIGEAGVNYPCGALIAVIAARDVPEADIDAFVASYEANFDASEVAVEGEAAPEPATLEVDGKTLRYLKQGEGDETIVLLHGFGGDLENWMFVQPALAEKCTTLALDLPGHGGSTKSVEGVTTIAGLADLVAKFMAALGVDKAHLVGHSLGGAVALKLALTQGDKVSSVSLLGSAGLGRDINMDYINGFMAASRRKELKPVLQNLVGDPALVTRDMIDGVVRYKRLDGAEEALRQMCDGVFAEGRQADVMTDALGASRQRITALWGSEDQISSPSQAQGLPGNVTVQLLEGVGHMPHLEAPRQVIAVILENL